MGQSGTSITGTTAHEIFIGTAFNESIQAGGGNDIVFAGGGDDGVYGGDGNDTLYGGKGNDYLSGGSDSDTYVFGRGDGQDTIYNYDGSTNKTDVLQFKSDIAVSDIKVSRDYNDLLLSVACTSDNVRFKATSVRVVKCS